MKIAYVLTQDRGGPADVTVTLAETLLAAGEHEVRVFGPRPARDPGLLADQFTTVEVPRKEDLSALRRMRSTLQSWRPDVVHAQDRRSALIVASFGRPAALVWTYHGVPYDVSEDWFRGTPQGCPPSVYSRAVLAADALLARRLSRVVVPSSAMGEFLQTRLHVHGRKVVQINNGVRIPESSPVNGPVRRLLFIGNLHAVKGLRYLLEALSRPGVMPADATLDVVGDGPARAEAEGLAQLTPLAGRVRFHGFRPDAADLLRDHDALVLSSLVEQQPLVVAQAMGAGRPVLATRVGDVPEMLNVTGLPRYLAPPGDVSALADELVRLFADPDPGALGSALASRARERYSAAACAEAHVTLYDSMAG